MTPDTTASDTPEVPDEFDVWPAQRRAGLILTVTGVVALIASFVLTVEKYALVSDPSYRPSCDFSDVLNCGTIMSSWQAGVFGFPNPFLGLIGFAVVVTTGVVLLTRAELPRWYWNAMFVGLTAALAFVHWLIWSSLFSIEALCPYCMVVWAMTIIAWWYTIVFLETADPTRERTFLRRFHWVVPTVWIALIALALYLVFWA